MIMAKKLMMGSSGMESFIILDINIINGLHKNMNRLILRILEI